ncbi:MAG: hypothetical protein WKF73_04335 [Nocardioidaceae bacterium]
MASISSLLVGEGEPDALSSHHQPDRTGCCHGRVRMPDVGAVVREHLPR